MKTMPTTEAKNMLPAVVKMVAATHQPVTITSHGKPSVTMVATEDLETLAWISDLDHTAEITESREAIEAG